VAFAAKILADSLSPDGVRLTTFEVTFPRIILSEFNTHRQFSRNSASSRAIPVEKMIKRVMEDPYVPSSWGKNQKGMSADENIYGLGAENALSAWYNARDSAIRYARKLLEIGVHKQLTNRLLEPFMWHTVICTSTEWVNFFHLRNNAQAHPDIQTIAKMMQVLYESPLELRKLNYGEWHLPLVQRTEDMHALFDAGLAQVDNADSLIDELLVKISVARCARVSYLTHDGKRDIQADLNLYDKLLTSGHLSPFEHVARPVKVFAGPDVNDDAYRVVFDGAHNPWCGNFRGWVQYRKLIPNESDILGKA